MITENLPTLTIHKLSKAQYERELASGRIDANALYLTPDEAVDLTPYATIEQLNSAVDSALTAFAIDDTLIRTDGVLKVNTTNNAEADNTLPITSAGVYTQLGNIQVLLETI
jgi:hypothetical protein